MGYTKETIKGTSWMSALRVSTRILSFLKIAVLARVLNPSQFGVFGIATLMLALLEMLTETGINIFLIQSKKEIKEYINSAWLVSILRGFIICLLILAFSPIISIFFKTPSAISVIILISFVPLIRGFINPSIISLQKELVFRKEFFLRLTIFFFDASVSIIIALFTSSVYSLAIGLIAGAVLELILSFKLFKNRPTFKVNKTDLVEIFSKGKWVTAYGIFNYIAQEGDNIIVGKLLGTSSLGIYQMGYKISTLPISEVTDVVGKVVFPVYTKIANDTKRLSNAFIKSTLTIAVLSSILGIIIFVYPKEIILILLGEKWLGILPVLRTLAVFGVLRAISGSASTLFLGIGKQKYVTIMTSFRFFGLAITIYPLVQLFGIVGAGYSALISVLVEIPIIIYFVFKSLSWKIIK